jgi:hypothetical protein
MSNNKKKFPLYRAFALGLVAVAVVGTVIFAGLNTNKKKDQASASANQVCGGASLKMAPGDTCRLKITYTNGEGQATTNSILKIFAGKAFEIKPANFTDEMFVDGASQGVANVTYANTVDTSNANSTWGTTLFYLPGSAKVTTSKTPGTLQPNTTGEIYFDLKLLDNVLNLNRAGTTKYAVGDVLKTPVTDLDNLSTEGVMSFLQATEITGAKIVKGGVDIEILAPSKATYTTTGTLTGTSGSAVGGTITITGSPALTGSATYTNGGSCSITGTIASNVFTPTGNIPAACPTGSNTTGKITSGATDVTGIATNFVGNTTGNCNDKFGDNCRLYFVGSNNAAVVWNSAFQTNTGWNRAQKYKDGVAKLVFDNIKTSAGATIVNGSACEFKLTRFGAVDTLKTLNANTTAGKAEVSLPVVDQTVNYYTVVVTCTETGTSEVVKDYDRLVLIVGASGDRTGPDLDL